MRHLRVVTLLTGIGCARGAVDEMPTTDGAATEPFEPSLVATTQLCKLLSNRNASDPTANDVQHAANILGADLGIPVVADDRLYLMFGDDRLRRIWSPAESPGVGCSGSAA
jgi:hypothetical protein